MVKLLESVINIKDLSAETGLRLMSTSNYRDYVAVMASYASARSAISKYNREHNVHLMVRYDRIKDCILVTIPFNYEID